MTDKLLPCPFCGSTDIRDEYQETFSVDSSYNLFGCQGCGAGFVEGDAAGWNRRTRSTLVPVLVEALKKAVRDLRSVPHFWGCEYTSIQICEEALAQAQESQE